MADAAGTTRGRDERGDGGGRARASTTATAARSRIRSLRLARGGAPSWAAGAERWVRVSAGAAAERPGWESARWRGRTDDGGGRGGGEGAPNGTRWGRHGGGVCGGGGVPFWVGSAATSVRHGTILRTDFFFLFFLEFTLRTIGQQVEAGGRKGEAIVKRTGGSLGAFGTAS